MARNLIFDNRWNVEKYKIVIEYCVPWNYLSRAVGTAAELLGDYQHLVESLTFVTGRGGVFEVKINDKLIFSKKTMQKRHAEPGEILALFREIVGPDVPTYPQD